MGWWRSLSGFLARPNGGIRRPNSTVVTVMVPAWTTGNDVQPLIHGTSYFRELLRRVQLMRTGDLLLFTDWRADPDQLLDHPDAEVSRVLCDAAARGQCHSVMRL